MDLAQARRYARHVALPELGPEGQRRILGAAVLVVDDAAAALALEAAVLYLGFAGISEFVLATPMPQTESSVTWLASMRDALPEAHFEILPVPGSGIAWAAALSDVSVVLRADFGDDALVAACRANGVPAVVVRATTPADDDGQIDLLSLRPETDRTEADVPSVPPSPRGPLQEPSPHLASAQIVAGTLAATEALWLLVGRPASSEDAAVDATGVIRHLQLPLSPGGLANTYNIPWPSLT